MLKHLLDLFLLVLCNLGNILKIKLEKLLESALTTLGLNHHNKVVDKARFLYNFSMFKKASVILIFLTACSFFQQEEQSVVSVADTDKGKEAIALGVELVDEREEISDEDAPLVLVQCVNESGYKFKEPKNFLDLYTTIASYFETITEQEAQELWSIIEDCALKYNLWGVADENQFEDPVQVSKEIDRSLFMACLLYTSPSPRDYAASRMPSTA